MKKILVIGPILAEWSEITAIAETLAFLNSCYILDFIDPLGNLTHDIEHEHFFAQWQDQLTGLIHHYDAFIGFSLGGVVLQQCFFHLEKENKPVILFSAPSFCDKFLFDKLTGVKKLIEAKSLIDALKHMNQLVFYPNNPPQIEEKLAEPMHSAFRLSRGLQFVLETDSRPILEKTTLNYLHFVGEKSQLVNQNNVITPGKGELLVVPDSGMRVLKDNSTYCIDPTLKFLERKLP